MHLDHDAVRLAPEKVGDVQQLAEVSGDAFERTLDRERLPRRVRVLQPKSDPPAYTSLEAKLTPPTMTMIAAPTQSAHGSSVV